MSRRLAVLCLLGLAGCASSLEKATRRSASTPDRPLVVMATADWCGPCKYFKEHVLPSPRVQLALRDVEFVMLDSAESRDEIRRLGVRGYPTFLVVTPDHEVVARMAGGVRAKQFLEFLTWGAPRWFSPDELAEEVEQGTSTRLVLYAARYHALEGNLERTRELYRQALDQLDESEEWRRSLIAWELTLVGSMGRPLHEAARAAAAFADEHPRSLELAKAVRFVLLAGQLGKARARELGERALGRFRDDPQLLDALTYELLAAGIPELAVRAARRYLELSPGDANAHDTLAEAYHYAGKRELALRHAAIAVDTETSKDRRRVFEHNRKRFAVGGISPTVVGTRRQFQRMLRRYKIR